MSFISLGQKLLRELMSQITDLHATLVVQVCIRCIGRVWRGESNLGHVECFGEEEEGLRRLGEHEWAGTWRE